MKTFNKVISLVLTVAFILTFMAIPAFAAGLEGFQTKSGNEKLVVEYYSDEGLSTRTARRMAVCGFRPRL